MNLFRKLFLITLMVPAFIHADVKVESREQVILQTSTVKKAGSSVAQNTKTVKDRVIETSYDALRDCLAFCGVEAVAFFNEICSFKKQLCVGFCLASLVALKCKLKNK